MLSTGIIIRQEVLLCNSSKSMQVGVSTGTAQIIQDLASQCRHPPGIQTAHTAGMEQPALTVTVAVTDTWPRPSLDREEPTGLEGKS
jgi:hypothetical protein